MVKVPTYTARETPNVSRFNGFGGQSGGAGAGSFGGNEAKDLQEFGGAIAKLAARTADIQNRARLVDARNQYEELSRDIAFEYSKLKGANAIGEQKKYIESLEQNRDKIVKDLDNSYQSEIFGDIADRSDMDTKFKLQRHEYIESARYKQETNKASLLNINAKGKEALSAYNYKEIVENNIKQAEPFLYSEGDSPEVKELKKRNYVNNMHREYVESLMEKNLYAAKDYYNTYKSSMPNGVKDAIEQRINIQEGERLGTEFRDKPITELQKALEGAPMRTQRSAYAAWSLGRTAEKSTQKAIKENAFSSAIQGVDSGKITSVSQIPNSLALSETEVNRVQDRINEVKRFKATGSRYFDSDKYDADVYRIKQFVRSGDPKVGEELKNPLTSDFFGKIIDKYPSKTKELLNLIESQKDEYYNPTQLSQIKQRWFKYIDHDTDKAEMDIIIDGIYANLSESEKMDIGRLEGLVGGVVTSYDFKLYSRDRKGSLTTNFIAELGDFFGDYQATDDYMMEVIKAERDVRRGQDIFKQPTEINVPPMPPSRGNFIPKEDGMKYMFPYIERNGALIPGFWYRDGSSDLIYGTDSDGYLMPMEGDAIPKFIKKRLEIKAKEQKADFISRGGTAGQIEASKEEKRQKFLDEARDWEAAQSQFIMGGF